MIQMCSCMALLLMWAYAVLHICPTGFAQQLVSKDYSKAYHALVS